MTHPTLRSQAARLGLAIALFTSLFLVVEITAAPVTSTTEALPGDLEGTGLYADFETLAISPRALPFTPQYPLWTDGATKRRWIQLPRGAAIDASDADRWVFPIGTKLWKEFSFGRRVETRFLERLPDGSWRYATYQWSEDGREARLAPERGVRGACETPLGAHHDLPSVTDCRSCHEADRSVVLGFDALQLSSDRDPLAPHAEAPLEGSIDLRQAVERGLVRGLDARLVATPPRIEADTPRERAALGYLHGNCASCHNAGSPLAFLGLDLEQRVAPEADRKHVLATLLDVPAHAGGKRVARGAPDESALVRRAGTRDPLRQMPPLGTRVVDHEALALLEDWIRDDTSGEESARR